MLNNNYSADTIEPMPKEESAEHARDELFFESLQDASPKTKAKKKKRNRNRKRHPWILPRILLITALLIYLFSVGYPRIMEARALIGSTAFTEAVTPGRVI